MTTVLYLLSKFLDDRTKIDWVGLFLLCLTTRKIVSRFREYWLWRKSSCFKVTSGENFIRTSSTTVWEFKKKQFLALQIFFQRLPILLISSNTYICMFCPASDCRATLTTLFFRDYRMLLQNFTRMAVQLIPIVIFSIITNLLNLKGKQYYKPI